MTPRQLKYFIEIARAGNITSAAATLHIAQPSLSHHIAALEAELGAPVFRRHARGVRLTQEGQRLFARATAILGQLDRLVDDVKSSPETPRGSVRLCLADAIASVVAAPLFRQTAATHPDVQLILTTAMSIDARRMVETRRVDLALIPNASEIPGLQSLAVMEESFCVFGQKKLFKGKGATIKMKDVCALPLTLADRDHDIRRHLERISSSLNLPLDVRYEINNAQVARALVRDGLAFGLWPSSTWPEADLDTSLARKEVVDPKITRTQSIVWFDDEVMTPATLAVKEILQEVIAKIPALP